MTTAHDFTLEGLLGGTIPLSGYKGQPLLIVNTASKCGFTPQYAGLETLWNEYKDDGLSILGVPSNDFGAQEPGSSSEIAEFCEINYGVSFPITAKVPVTGFDAHPLFKWLCKEGGIMAWPRWNFYKYLIGPDGRLLDWFASATQPDSPKLRRAVEKALGR